MSFAAGFYVTILVQLLSAFVRQRVGRRSAQEVREYLRKIKVENLSHTERRSNEKFKRSCEKQIEMEEEEHRERLRIISEDLEQFLNISARAQTLQDYKLNISPYIIRNTTLPFSGNRENTDRCIFCLLTGSNDTVLNALLPPIDYSLGDFISTEWGLTDSRHISYYDNAWNRGKAFYEEDIIDLKGLFRTIPFLSFSPVLKKKDKGCMVELITHFWGLASIDIKTSVTIFSSKKESLRNITDEEKDIISHGITRNVLSQIGFFSDVYFWNLFHEPPVFPDILQRNASFFGDSIVMEMKNRYLGLFHMIYYGFPEGSPSEWESSKDVDLLSIRDDIEMNNSNFPERRLSFLNAIRCFVTADNLSDWSRNAFFEFCEERDIDTQNAGIEDIIRERKEQFSENQYAFLKEFLELYVPRAERYKRSTDFREDEVHFTPESYINRRDELIRLIDATLAVPGITDQVKRELQSVKKKCVEDEYDIVLCAQFETGKSTTFNALCGGREISPRGAMSRTSACRITVSNLSDPGQDEFALVHWKSDQELLLNVRELLERRIRLQDLKNTKTEDVEEYGSIVDLIDLGKDSHLSLVRNVLYEEYQRVKGSFLREDADAKEMLGIALLSVNCYKDPVIKELRKRERFAIEEIGDICVFPEKINTPLALSAKDAAFAFVSGIECFIHSPHLSRLGCSFTDCPGLFASAWDTKVAYESIPDADAILYLLPGEKQIGKQDAEANLLFHRMGWDEKVFYALNSQKTARFTQNILQKDRQALELDSIGVFNAQLFFLGSIGDLYVEGKLDSFSKERFETMAKFTMEGKSFEESWVRMVNSIGFSTEKDGLKEIKALTKDSTALVLAESHFSDVFDPIEQHIIHDKAYSILIEKGVLRLFKELSIVEDLLINKERDCYKASAECEKEYLATLAAFSDFEEKVIDLLKHAFPASMYSAIAADGYDTILRNSKTIESISVEIAHSLVNKIGDDHKQDAFRLRDAIKRAQKAGMKIEDLKDLSAKEKAAYESIRNDLVSTVRSIVDEKLRSSAYRWAEEIFNGRNRAYEQAFIPHLDSLASNIRREWKAALRKNSSLEPYGISFPANSVNSFMDRLKEMGYDFGLVDDLSKEFTGIAYSTLAKTISMIVGMIVLYILAVWIYPLIGIIIILVLNIFGDSIESAMNDGPIQSPEQLNRREKKLFYEIHAQLSLKFDENDTKDSIMDNLKRIPEMIVEYYKNFYQGELNEKRSKLELNIEERRKQRDQSQSEKKRKETADRCRRIRKDTIIPLFRQYDAFLDSCKNKS